MRTILLSLGILVFPFISQTALAQSAADTTNATPSANTAPTTTTPIGTQTQQIESTVHSYLLKKPEVVVEALQAYQQKQMESMQKMFKETQQMAPKYADALFHQAKDPTAGDSKGKVTLVEFSDYQCSHCIEISPLMDTLIKANPDLRVVIKEFPIRGQVSEIAAKAALAANRQGKYWTFRDALFKVTPPLTEDKIYEIAKSVNLNVDQLKKDMNEPAIRDEVKANQKLAQTLKLIGTPAFFIAKSDIKTDAPADAVSYIPGIASQEQLQEIINKMKG